MSLPSETNSMPGSQVSSPHPVRLDVLVDLMLALYSFETLRQWLRTRYGKPFLDQLPGPPVAPREFAFQAADLMQREGFIDEPFFSALTQAHPRRACCIEHAKLRWLTQETEELATQCAANPCLWRGGTPKSGDRFDLSGIAPRANTAPAGAPPLVSIELHTTPAEGDARARLRTLRMKLGSLHLLQISWIIGMLLVFAAIIALLSGPDALSDDWEPGRWIAMAEYRGAFHGPPGKFLRDASPEQRRLAWFLLGASDGLLDSPEVDPANSTRLQGDLMGAAFVRPEERRAQRLANVLEELAGDDRPTLARWFHLGRFAGRMSVNVDAGSEVDIPSTTELGFPTCLKSHWRDRPCLDKASCRDLIRHADVCFFQTLEDGR